MAQTRAHSNSISEKFHISAYLSEFPNLAQRFIQQAKDKQVKELAF